MIALTPACQADTLATVQTNASKREPSLADVVERAFSARMRAARKAAGIAQTTLAEELGKRLGHKIDSTGIVRMEQRANNESGRAIRLGEAVAIASILGISLDEILQPSLEQQISAARGQLEQAETTAAAAERDRRLAAEHLQQLLDVLHANERPGENDATVQDGPD
jgi:transcriptional regulator with XRE-family HTH domain